MNRPDDRTARIQFSMVLDEASLFGIKPLKNAPTPAVINTLANQVQARLQRCRQEWWDLHRTVCLDNKAVRRVAPSKVSIQATRGAPGVIVARSGVYRPKQKGRGFEVVASVRWVNGVTHDEVVE